MKRAMLIHLIVWQLIATWLGAATTRSDVKILEASEEIKFMSQKIVKEYFYQAKRANVAKRGERKLQAIVSQLDEKLRLIATATRSKDARNLLSFLSLSSEQIGEIVVQPYSMERAALMIDYSETLLEGATSLTQEHAYDFSLEEQMFIRIKNMEYLLERINKYYLAYHAGFVTKHTLKALYGAIDQFDTELAVLFTYSYEGSLLKELEMIRQYWRVVRVFYVSIKKHTLPNILYLSTLHLESVLADLALFHSKNQ